MANSLNSLITAIPNFSGENSENVKLFVDNISAVCNLEAWPNERRILLLKLHCRGKAADFLSSDLRASKSEDFSELCNLLLKKFSPSLSFQEISQKFSDISQKPNQSVAELAELIEQQAHKFITNYSDNPEIESLRQNLMLQKFLEAIRPDIKFDLMKIGPQNFSDAVKQAKNIEKALELNAFTVNNINQHPSAEIEILLKQQIEANKKIEELTNTVKQLSQKNSTISCHICGRQHLTTDCWNFPTNQNKRSNDNFRQSNIRRGSQNFRGRQFRPYHRRQRDLN